MLDAERRRVVVAGAEPWLWRGRAGRGAHLVLGAGLLEPAGAPFEVEVVRVLGPKSELLARARSRGAGWLDFDLDLSRFADQNLELRITPHVGAQPGPALPASRIAWGSVVLEGVGQPSPARPNVLFIIVDTLRADHLSTYGYLRPTTPHVDSHLASRGVTVEHAYSQAPWTLPSAASFHTSRYPGQVLGDEVGGFGIPAGVSTLAEWLEKNGYETAACVGNPTLHSSNGFDRGFATYYTPPAVVDSMNRHGDDINRRARPWLRAHQREPFFLYLHYLDPHDPYENPEIVSGRSPFFPDYRGGISGLWMQGIYTGQIALPDPAADIRHLTALYDSEIHYLDARVGELLDAIAPEVLANTLIVFTSDHGEELHDHGGWKHGQTLYDEQIRVPLIWRWDARLPAGRRVDGPARLLDIAPTIAAAVGAEADPGWQGVNLLPALAGEAPFPRLPVFAQHHSSGPLRAAAILDGKKLMLFNHRAPFAPGDGLQAFLWRQDLARLQRAEFYDLGLDPDESHNLIREGGAVESHLPILRRQLDRQLPGVRVIVSGLPVGAQLEGRVEFDRPLDRWQPYFLGDQDRVEVAGSEGRALRFSLAGDALEKGFLVEGPFAAVTSIEARWHLSPGAPPGPVLLGERGAYAGGVAPVARLASHDTPEPPGGPALRIWMRPEQAGRVSVPENAETLARLRALGYIR